MAYLLDTNILLRLVSPDDPMHTQTVAAIDLLNARREKAIIAPQNLIELWNVATRPVDKNGLGLSPPEAAAEVARLKELFILLPDTEQIYSEWERLVKTHEVKGVNVHDTRLVAFMLVHGLSHILTFNIKDFRRFRSEITPISPKKIMQSNKSS